MELQRTSEGVSIRWKQWMTDAQWSDWVVLCPRSQMATIAEFRPALLAPSFDNESAKLAWIDKFERYIVEGAQFTLPRLNEKVAELRQLVCHTQPAYAACPSLDHMIRGLRALGPRSAATVSSMAPWVLWGWETPSRSISLVPTPL